MIVAVISTYTVADDPLPANIGVPLATGSYLSLLVALGQEEGERLALKRAMARFVIDSGIASSQGWL